MQLSKEDLKNIHFTLLCEDKNDEEMVNSLFRYIYSLECKYKLIKGSVTGENIE